MRSWKKLKSEYIFKHPILNLRKDKCQMADGKIVEDYFVMEKKDFAIVIPITSDNKLIMVKQYRHPLNKIDIEFPAGFIHKREKPIAAAKRELLEETGYKAKKITKLFDFFASPGTLNNYGHLFLATDVELTSKQNLDQNEDIEVLKLSLNQVKKLFEKGQIKDSASCLAMKTVIAEHLL